MRGLAPLPLLMVLLPALSFGAPDAGPPPREFESYLLAATRLYDSLDYERALDYLGRAKGKAETMDDDVQVSLYEGIVLAELGRTDDSTTAFRAALLLKSDARLPLKVSPKVEDAFQLERDRVQKELAARPRPPPLPPPSAPPAPPTGLPAPLVQPVRANRLSTALVGLFLGFYSVEYERVMAGSTSLLAEGQLINYQPTVAPGADGLLRLAVLQGGIGARFYLGSAAPNGFYLSPQLDLAAGASQVRERAVTTTTTGSNVMVAGTAGYSATLFDWMALAVGGGVAYGLGPGPLQGWSLRLRLSAGVAF